ncbi:MAG: hypothetical protein PHI35_02590 [Victivallaceae bacterium]|nr:hypothetical protein [Victivallaceae bacterium]
MRKFVIIAAIAGLFFLPSVMPRAEAIDPVTIAVLAPMAIRAAEIATPFVIRGIQAGGAQMLRMGVNLIEVFKLPLGVLESTLGAPFGMLSGGVNDIVQGVAAPFKLVGNALLLPFAFFGLVT